MELARSGHPIAQLAREFEASANAIRKWVKAGRTRFLGARSEDFRLRIGAVQAARSWMI
jgi:transposase-like protein